MFESPYILNHLWFLLVGLLFTGYAVLDGFDLGVGILHPFAAKTDAERRVLLNAIGPVWAGSEVWLVTGGGALFAAFPQVYATVFSGFYLAFILLLFALILRAVAIECRGKRAENWWRRSWDWAFCLGSTLIALLLGVAVGNLAAGIPLVDGEYREGLLGLLRPWPLLIGVLSVALFALHGGLYAILKTEGELREKLRRAVQWSGFFFLLCLLFAWVGGRICGAPPVYSPARPLFLRYFLMGNQWVFFLLLVLLFRAIRRRQKVDVEHEAARVQRDRRAFLASSAVIVAFMALFGAGMFPNLVASSLDPAQSLTCENAASSQKTLGIMLTIAAIGMPLVVAYTAWLHRIFRGKVKVNGEGY